MSISIQPIHPIVAASKDRNPYPKTSHPENKNEKHLTDKSIHTGVFLENGIYLPISIAIDPIMQQTRQSMEQLIGRQYYENVDK